MNIEEKLNMTMLCDFYELTMGNGYLDHNMQDRITYFDVFFRSVPDDGGYAIAAGLDWSQYRPEEHGAHEEGCGCGEHGDDHECCGGHGHDDSHECCGGHGHDDGHECCCGHHHGE